MNKLLAAVVATTFALGGTTCFAADGSKKVELTKEDRTELRNRAEKLTSVRTATAVPAKKNEFTEEERMELRNRAAKLVAERSVPEKSMVKTTTRTHKKHVKSNRKATTPAVKQPRSGV